MIIRMTGILLLSVFLVGCSSGLGNEYYRVRDENVVKVLELCSYEEPPVFEEGTTVKELAVGFVVVKSSLRRCQAYSEEVVKLLTKDVSKGVYKGISKDVSKNTRLDY